MKLIQIGTVSKTADETALEIEPEFWEATLNLDEFSHMICLWWIDGHDNPESRTTLIVTPKPARGNPAARSGVFACRSPLRPNPIGHSIVALKAIRPDEHKIVIDRIDANHGTPILDIKPYMPSSDCVANTVVPSWFEGLESRYS
ncbi:tRNA (N6-threonylcarbamoyladenosine(37)-N6)-methyltransferase TrmO [Candidatus Thorarchaeota archaeon]|nr:MAG: tRNA (N6-threonylcarbamoyladenosine(37)-N6)-methyltransferase TrmO [Candidatus Thorarchaeota archaeon]